MPATDYLVQYGRLAHVGQFASSGDDLARGERVVVRTPRGVEIGDVLCPVADKYAGLLAPSAGGEILRSAAGEDEQRSAGWDNTGQAVIATAEEWAAESGLPLTFLDAEIMLDGSAAVLHVVPWDECDADPLFTDLSVRFGMAVRALDVSRTPLAKDPPAPTGSCGKPGCGTTGGGCSSCGTKSGGGCSTGSCSSGAVKSADELSVYFAGLRKQMEARTERTPLN
ncbi:hypothetical protein [Fimbriiglobus ruber]|uniref:Signal peptidase-like protein n=1 Tax=Fimbriiglobus ruber TaxID=1908690 RepID=A0A225DFG2_9BACT|nr:hypothetical protein [Fimbriiglobus ruber]OWK34827.1 Signal peptidase-like protein [Fimbriiglobus ruber]